MYDKNALKHASWCTSISTLPREKRKRLLRCITSEPNIFPPITSVLLIHSLSSFDVFVNTCAHILSFSPWMYCRVVQSKEAAAVITLTFRCKVVLTNIVQRLNKRAVESKSAEEHSRALHVQSIQNNSFFFIHRNHYLGNLPTDTFFSIAHIHAFHWDDYNKYKTC